MPAPVGFARIDRKHLVIIYRQGTTWRHVAPHIHPALREGILTPEELHEWASTSPGFDPNQPLDTPYPIDQPIHPEHVPDHLRPHSG